MSQTSAATPHQELAAWLKLTRTPGLERGQILALLNRFGLPEQVLKNPIQTLAEVVGRDLARQLRADLTASQHTMLAATAQWLTHARRDVVTLADVRYPPLLLHEDAAAALLFVDGEVGALLRPRLALIAPKAATRATIDTAMAFALALIDAGVGLLLHFGSDFTAAIARAALKISTADLLCVLDGGPDRIAPARHIDTARALAARGALVSEVAPGEVAPNLPLHLLEAALPSAVLVFEAGVNSLEVRTARQAGTFGRDLFAIPGSIHAPLARGCHQLIREGARLVESVSDVLEEAGHKLCQ